MSSITGMNQGIPDASPRAVGVHGPLRVIIEIPTVVERCDWTISSTPLILWTAWGQMERLVSAGGWWFLALFLNHWGQKWMLKKLERPEHNSEHETLWPITPYKYRINLGPDLSLWGYLKYAKNYVLLKPMTLMWMSFLSLYCFQKAMRILYFQRKWH